MWHMHSSNSKGTKKNMKIFMIFLAQYFYLPYICIALEQLIELWCNGNTADFGSVVQGSNPCSSTSALDNR